MRTYRSYLALLAVCVGLALALGFDLLPILRGGDIFNWQWPRNVAPPERVFVFAMVLAGYVAGAWTIGRTARPRLALLWGVMGAVVLSYVVTWLRYDSPLLEWYYRTVSLTATGPYTAAGIINWQPSTLQNWLGVMVDFRPLSQHVALSPPGLPMLMAGISEVFAFFPALADALHRTFLPYQCNNYTLLQFTPAEWASASAGVLMPLWGALAVLPLYSIAKRLNIPHAPDIAMAWALVPALAMFAASWNTAYPLFVLIVWRGLLSDRAWAWFGAGLLLSLLIFANLSLVPLGLLCGVYVLWREVTQASDHWQGFRRAVVIGLWFGAGVLSLWVVFGLVTGITPLDIIHVAFEKHLDAPRDYVLWLWMHAWEWALLGVLPFVLVWLVGLRKQAHPLGIALALTLAILLLSNTARGETGRVWLFFAPFALLAGASVLHNRLAWAFVYPAQAVIFLALGATWAVMAAPDTKIPAAPPPAHNITEAHIAHFTAGFDLVGWEAEQDGNMLTLRLNWRATEQLTTPYYFAALPVSPSGKPAEALVWQADATRYPTTCWQVGSTLSETVQLTLPEDAEAGDWYISLSAFANVKRPLDTVPVVWADGTRDRQIGLGAVPVRAH